MKQPLIIILSLLVIKSYAQCGREYPSGFYHSSKFVNGQGDTLNQLDDSGLYEGLHLYTDDQNNLYNDTISYTIGRFHHGLPVGDWKDHCKDGTYSIGQYSSGSGESSSDGKGGWITKQQGIYNKIGVWKYYDNKGQLQTTLRYDRSHNHKGWMDQIFEMDSTGKFILIEYKFNSRHNLDSRFKKRVKKRYSKNGVLIYVDNDSFWKDISYEYNENGRLTKSTKYKKFSGKTHQVSIVKEYNSKGKVKCKSKCKHNPHLIGQPLW